VASAKSGARAPGARDEQEEAREPRGQGASLVAEFVGTIVVTVGTVAPAAVARGAGLHLPYAVETACTGLAMTAMIYSLRYVSGAHFNPCTTLAFAVRGDFAWARVPGYVAVQFAGAICAGAIVVGIFHPERAALLPQIQLGAWPAFWLEIVLTFVAVMVALSTANVARFIGPESAIANGATTVLDRWIGGYVSGGSMNPARTLGPALVAGGFSEWWVYATAPPIGTAIALAIVAAMWRRPRQGRRGG
ncbi:MAG: putative aquaporin, partial [Candidatus Eremiobacteraeota bacterium]|nr:putative aquaporin [Candidatus Eremiobacteraeota bacterium]